LAEKERTLVIRILTYNIHGARGVDGKQDYKRIGKFLSDQKIQIALLQEFDSRNRTPNQDLLDLQGDHFPFLAKAPTLTDHQGWYGNVVLSVFPIVKETIVDISALGREPRNILEVFVETSEGLLHVVNTHKGLKSLERHHQMTKLNDLLSRKSEVPLIVGGDINQWHAYSEALQKLNQALHPLTAGPTFPTRFPLFHLDRLWCRPKSLVQFSKVCKTRETKVFSDHYPVVGELKLAPLKVLATES
jgi:endonuclease/exonuclease/phosphatase family metal-dependent hydrolase